MKINSYEISAYLVLVMVTILLASFSLLSVEEPNFSIPPNPQLPENTNQNTLNNDPVDPPPSPAEPATNFINGLFYILLIVVIALIVRASMNLRVNLAKRGSVKSLEQDGIRRNLEDARTHAFRIIEEGLVSHNYKIAFIEAYIALDLGLEDFREIKRPKHITPKEYSYSVRPPVFKPSVFKFVSKFYELRYGDRDAERTHLLDFKNQLMHLFIEEVPEELKIQWQQEFDSNLDEKESYVIPRTFNPTLPEGMS